MIKKLIRQLTSAMPSFFANVGKKLAAGMKLTCKNKNHKDYLGQRQQSLKFLNPTGEFEVLQKI